MGELRVRVLGGLDVEGVAAAALGSRKARTLLKVLALARGAPVRVDRLADCLWGDLPPARPADQVAVLVSRLRGVLGADCLRRTDAGYALDVAWLDLDALGELVGEAARRLEGRGPAPARAAAAAALALARGPLLPDEPDAAWAEADRALAERLVARARQVGAEAALAVGDNGAAAELAEGALTHDPYDEAALRTLMAGLAAAGRPGSALAAYARVRSLLAEELGVSPSPATEAIHDAILLDETAAGVRFPTTAAATSDRATRGLWGRDGEVAVLDAALARAAAGSGELVVVEGEAGMGKTRLLDAWTARLRDDDRAVVLVGRCEEMGRSLPLQAVADAIETHVRGLGAGDVAALLGADADLLAPLLGLPTADAAHVPLAALADREAVQALLFSALLALLRRMGGHRPVVLVLDDVHLAGASTIEWLHLAARRAGGLPLLLVAATRAEEGAPLPEATRIRLGPLDLDAAGAIVGTERAADLHARSGGHPLFLVELAAAEPGTELPISIRDAVAARCERAGAAAATLRTAAIIGAAIDLDLLATVAQAPPAVLLDHLEEGVRFGILVEQGQGFGFRHELVREALAAGTGPSRQALVHREVGRALAARARADPLAVAHHARLGGDTERAAAALVEAARVALARYDPGEAETLLDRAVDLHDGPDARLERARVRLIRARLAEAAADAGAAAALGAGGAALEVGAWAAHYRRDWPTALRLADEGASSADDAPTQAACLTIGGWARHASGDLGGAEERLQKAVRLLPGASDAALWLGGLRVHQGRAEEGETLLRAATRTGASPTHVFPVAHARMFHALCLASLGRAADALEVLDALDAEVERLHAVRWTGRADNIRGWILRNLGATGTADDHNLRAVEEAGARALDEPLANGLLDLADGRLQVGDLDGAHRYLDRAVEVQRKPGDHAMKWRHELRARLLTARTALAEGRVEEAAAAADDVVTEAMRRGVERYRALAVLVGVQARSVTGAPVDLDATRRALDALPVVAGLEAWWVTATTAAATGVDAWWTLAGERVASLVQRVPPSLRTGLERHAAVRLELLRVSPPGR